jgi:phosphatidylinositol glycan class A protein
MVSDFFHPNVGGVENHIYMLSVELMRRGHKVRPLAILSVNPRVLNPVQQPQVIVITHSHPPDRIGIRWLLPGIKVYHIPFRTIASSATLPNFFTFLPYLRTIVLRERIDLIHTHASLSSLSHEAILHAHLFGMDFSWRWWGKAEAEAEKRERRIAPRTVFTDHSLFGFDNAAAILTNKLLACTLVHVDAAICVSHTGYAIGNSGTFSTC